jgi:germination protein M
VKAWLVPLVCVLALVGCGSDDDGAAGVGTTTEVGTETVTPTDPTTTEPTETADEQQRLLVYFMRDEKVGAAARLVPETRAVGAEAVRALLAGPSDVEADAGLSTAIPAGTRLLGLDIADGVATVDLSEELASDEARAQVVHTLTQFPTVERVRFGDGEAVERADFEDLAPQILVEYPALGETVNSPLRIRGTANTFEATFMVALLDESGREVARDFVTATSGSGERGTFDKELPFDAEGPFEGTVKVWEASAEDGSEIHVVEIPVAVVP